MKIYSEWMFEFVGEGDVLAPKINTVTRGYVPKQYDTDHTVNTMMNQVSPFFMDLS